MVLRESIENRRRLARYFTSLVSVTFFTKRKRGDGGKWRIGYTNLFKKDKRYKNTHLQEVILFEANILYIESFLHYIIITTKDKEYKIKESISAFEQK